MLNIIIVALVVGPLCLTVDNFIKYGKENNLYIKEHL